MKLKSAFRFIALALAATISLQAQTDNAATSKRKRPTKPGAPTVASLVVTVTNASTNAAILNASVEIGELGGMTDAAGKISFPTLPTGSHTVLVNRVGYQSVTRTVTLVNGANTLNVALTPGPVATLETTDGVTRTVDVTRLEFGYVVTFVGYRKSTKIDACKTDGTATTIDKSQLKSINGPATVGAAGSCCTFPSAEQVSVTLKSNETFTAILKDTCEGYKFDVITNDIATGDALFIPFSKVKKLTLP